VDADDRNVSTEINSLALTVILMMIIIIIQGLKWPNINIINKINRFPHPDMDKECMTEGRPLIRGWRSEQPTVQCHVRRLASCRLSKFVVN